MAKKVYEEQNISNIAIAIRGKTGSDKTYKTSAMPDGINDVYEAGKQAEYDRFWDIYQENGKRVRYDNAFTGDCWVDAIYNPKYPIIVSGNGTAAAMFLNCFRLTSTKVPIVLKTKNTTQAFSYLSVLKTIPSIEVTEEVVYTNWLNGCGALEEINFTENSVIANDINFSRCAKLTLGSLKSIISALKDFSGTNKEFTYTLTLSANSKILLEAEGATAPNGDTWLNYVAAKRWNV